jgi:hypothetical protein
MRTKKKAKRTKLGLELEGTFKEMAAHLRGEIQLPSYVAHHDLFTPKRIKGTSKNCPRSSGAPNLPANDSALFSF